MLVRGRVRIFLGGTDDLMLGICEQYLKTADDDTHTVVIIFIVYPFSVRDQHLASIVAIGVNLQIKISWFVAY
jgi:hypothetical protein